MSRHTIATWIGLLLCCAVLPTPVALGEVLESIPVQGATVELHSGRAESRFLVRVEGTSQTVQQVHVSTLEKPARLVVDLLGTAFGRQQERRVVERSGVRTVRIADHREKVRVVFDLDTDSAQSFRLRSSQPEVLEIDVRDAPVLHARELEPLADQRGRYQASSDGNKQGTEKAPTMEGARGSVRSSVRAFTIRGETIGTVEINPKHAFSKTGRMGDSGETSSIEPLVPGDGVEMDSVLSEELTRFIRDLEDRTRSQLDEFVAAKEVELEDEGKDSNHAIILPFPPERTLEAGPPLELADQSWEEGRFAHPSLEQAGGNSLAWAGIFLAVVGVALLSMRKPPQPALISAASNAGQRLRDCYEVLGCAESASEREIKTRYKHLIKVFHSDRLSSKDLPAELIELSNEQFRRIHDAYERVREARGFR